jgi:hypothetical protein
MSIIGRRRKSSCRFTPRARPRCGRLTVLTRVNGESASGPTAKRIVSQVLDGSRFERKLIGAFSV